MRWLTLDEEAGGLVYVESAAIDAIGPSITENGTAMRGLYLSGGQLLIVLDSPSNMEKVFAALGIVP